MTNGDLERASKAAGLTRRETAAALIGAAAAGLAGSAGFFPAKAAETTAPAEPSPWTKEGMVPFGGGTLHYAEREGEGVPIVLLPKLGGWIADWRKAAALLSPGRRVIAIDPPAHGDSKMFGPPPYIMTVPQSAAIVLSVLDQIGVDRFAVAGNSMGGIIGIVLAALWPKRVAQMTVVSTSLIGRMTLDDLKRQDAERAEQTRLAAEGKGLTPEQSRMQMFATLDPDVVAEQLASRDAAGDWLRPCERGVGAVGVTDYLSRVTIPSLFIYSDRGHYSKYGEVGPALVKGARSVTIHGAGSFVHQERPEEVAAAINEALRKDLPS